MSEWNEQKIDEELEALLVDIPEQDRKMLEVMRDYCETVYPYREILDLQVKGKVREDMRFKCRCSYSGFRYISRM